MQILIVLLFYSLFYLLGILLHEAGHLVCGLATGYRFVSFRVASYIWVKEGDRIRFLKSPTIKMAGQCLMAPPDREEDFHFVLYNLGGGLANLWLGLLVLFLLPLAASPSATAALYGILFSQFLLAVLNLCPLVMGLPNDGMNLWKALRSPDAAHGLYLMLRTNDEVVRGKRYREYAPGAFALREDADTSNHFVAYTIIVEAARLYDLGAYDEAIAATQHLLSGNLLPYYRNLIAVDHIYHYLVHRPDPERVRLLRQEKGVQKLLAANLPPLVRVAAAHAFLAENNAPKGLELLQKAKTLLHSFPNRGVVLMETEYLAHLETLLQATIPATPGETTPVQPL